MAHARNELRFLNENRRIRRDGLRNPNARSDRRVAPDHHVPAEDRRVRVHDDVVFQRWMTLRIAHKISVRVSLKAQRAEGHPLIELNPVADLARFADHHAGAVINEEMIADLRAGVNVDSRVRMSVFGHDARNKGNAELPKNARDAVHDNRVEAGIAEDDLVRRLARGITFNRGLDVHRQLEAKFGDPSQEFAGNFLAAELNALAQKRVARNRPFAERARYLRAERLENVVYKTADVIFYIRRVKAIATTIAGKKDFVEVVQHVNDRFFIRERTTIETTRRTR